jgi:CHAT domain-containing protein
MSELEVSRDVWRTLEKALTGHDIKTFEKLCRRHETSLRADFPGRFTVPAALRSDPAAVQRYANVTFAVAERLGIQPPRIRLSERLQHSLGESDALAARGEQAAALAVLVDLVDSGTPLSEPAESGQALCYGRMGTLAWNLDRRKDAWQWTMTAQELCHRLRDADGCLNYIANLHFIADGSGAHADALAVAGMATQHIQEHGPTRLLPRWLAAYTEAMRQADHPPDEVRDFAAAAARYAREISGDDPDKLSRTLSNLAITLHRIGDYTAARPLAEEAVRIRRAVVDLRDPTLGLMLGNLGKILAAADDEQAEPVLLEAVELLTSGGDDYDEHLSSAWSNLAAFYQRRGDHAAAGAIYRDLVRGKAPSAVTLRNFAALEGELGNPARQRMLHDLADEAAPGSNAGAPSDAVVFQELFEQAEAEHDLGNDHRAVRLLFQADELARRMSDPAAWRRAVVVVLLAECGHPVAEQQLIGALEAARTDPDCVPGLLRSMESTVGMWYLNQERPADALVHLEQDVAGVDPATADVGQLGTFNRIALAYHHLDDLTRAEELYRLVLARRRELLPGADPAVAQSLFNLGMLYLAMGRPGEAATLLQEQFDLEDTHLVEVFSASSEDQRLVYVRKLLTYLDDFIVQAMTTSDFAPTPEVVEVLANAVLRRKTIVAEAVARERVMLTASPDELVAAIAMELTEVRHALQRLTLKSTSAAPEREQQASELRDRQRRLDIRLADRLAAPEPGTAANLPTWRTVADALPPETALVEFYRMGLGADGGYLSLVITAESQPRLFTHTTVDNLDPAIDTWRELLINDDPAEPAVGVELHRVLIDRIAPGLAGVSRLLLSPDAGLNRLPFAAIPAPDGTRLVDRYEIGLLTTGRDLLRRRAGRSGRPAVLADPDYDAGRTREAAVQFGALPETRDEGLWIAERIDADLWVGADATASRVKTMRSPLVLHLATHGYALSEPLRPGQPPPVEGLPPEPGPNVDPLLCAGLALAGANAWLAGQQPSDGIEDGILTAADVYDLDLLGTELVVLGACNTGLGLYHPGEGIFGLRRVFEIAGARSVLVTIWNVPSGPTVLLMREFYRGLLRGHSRITALRAAQQAVRRRYPEPTAWAPFALFGDPTPVTFGSTTRE